MTKRQLEKVRKRFEEADLSRYHILTYDEMLKVNGGSGSDSDDDDAEPEDDFANEETSDVGNTASAGSANEAGDATEESGRGSDDAEEETGGHEVENSHEAVANAEPGDTITRNDGTEVTLSEEDIKYEQNYCDEHGIEWDKGDESASANAGVPSEEPAEDFPEEDGGSSSDGELTEDKSENRQTEATDSSASKDRIEGEEEKSAGEGKNSSKDDEKESSAGGTKNGENSSGKSEQATSNNKNEPILQETKKGYEKTDTTYCSPFGNQPHVHHTQNQTKTEKEVYAEAEFVEKSGEMSCKLGAGLMSVESELNKGAPVSAQGKVDIANANFNFGVNEGGLHGGFEVNGFSASGSIGLDTNSFSLHCGGSVGFTTGFGFGIDLSDGVHLIADASFLIGGSIDIRIGGHND